MNRIATMTVIRGNGECEAIMNGVVQREIQKIQEEHRKERDILNMHYQNQKRNCDRLRFECLQYRNVKPSLFKRIRERVSMSYAHAIACVFVFGEALGLWDMGLIDNKRARAHRLDPYDHPALDARRHKKRKISSKSKTLPGAFLS